jgi:SagB-type dehydrogenase family enzyme
MAYNFRDVPLRYVPSAGGLNSTECYLIVANVEDLQPGAYVYDGRTGLRHIASGLMIDRLAASGAGAEWVGSASVVAVMVCEVDRLRWKYSSMSHKLALLDVGAALEHLGLVATALELRSSIVGNVDAGLLGEMLRLDARRQRPIASVVIGTRGQPWGW